MVGGTGFGKVDVGLLKVPPGGRAKEDVGRLKVDPCTGKRGSRGFEKVVDGRLKVPFWLEKVESGRTKVPPCTGIVG